VETVLLIANARAGSVSARTKEVIIKALSADFKLEVVDTEARDHATDLARDAVDRGFDAVLVFGGDGTINEAAQAVVGSDVALGILPGGSTNVMARSLGVPRDPVEATAFGASRMRSRSTRRVNVGQFEERYFLFSAGMGLDARVVQLVEENPEAKRKHGEWLFLGNALKAAFMEFRGADPSIAVRVSGYEPVDAVLGVCCNARPFTYFKRFPVDACPEAQLDSGLDLLVITKVRAMTIPRIAWGLLVSRNHVNGRNARYHHDLEGFELVARGPLPVQVDGDYIGERDHGEVRLVPTALTLLA
jgi:diacylglycerol kinase family enzyme